VKEGRPAGAESAASVAIDTGELTIASGLSALLRPALALCAKGAEINVLSGSRAVAEDVASWCRSERHEFVGSEEIAPGRWRHRIVRGTHGADPLPRETSSPAPGADGRLLAADVIRHAPFPERADPATGFAPRGAQIEPGGPRYPFSLLDRDHVAPPEIAQIYDQAVAAQWDASRDIPWRLVKELQPQLERALVQVMTFLAENELSALYVPARFIPRIHPHYAEVAMALAAQMNDEARHIDVFLKRARLSACGLGVSAATTSRSLLSLLEVEDFTEASFLLSVLGEGTFLDLLRFVEEHAPDETTHELVRRARADETRHVRFGIAHVRHALGHDPELYGRLEAAVRRRAATMHGAGGVPASLQDALTILAARGVEPRAVARGHDAFRALLDEMHENRIKRLVQAGFTDGQAATLSALHTPNFM
jgi:TusA-related sulfurtransferase